MSNTVSEYELMSCIDDVSDCQRTLAESYDIITSYTNLIKNLVNKENVSRSYIDDKLIDLYAEYDALSRYAANYAKLIEMRADAISRGE